MIACSSATVFADDIDLSTLTCSKFQHSDDETIKLILTASSVAITKIRTIRR